MKIIIRSVKIFGVSLAYIFLCNAWWRKFYVNWLLTEKWNADFFKGDLLHKHARLLVSCHILYLTTTHHLLRTQQREVYKTLCVLVLLIILEMWKCSFMTFSFRSNLKKWKEKIIWLLIVVQCPLDCRTRCTVFFTNLSCQCSKCRWATKPDLPENVQCFHGIMKQDMFATRLCLTGYGIVTKLLIFISALEI